jgi:hypothetical protein
MERLRNSHSSNLKLGNHEHLVATQRYMHYCDNCTEKGGDLFLDAASLS